MQPSPPDTITIDGFGPQPVARSASVTELGELVRRCAAEGRAVYPVGGGTMLDYGLPPSKPGLAIDTRSLDQVIDYPARDMTITVQAGVTIARLRDVTRAEGLDLPIDVPDPDRATLGGVIACNVSGPRRYGYGTFRDYVLGITTVNDRGEETKAGGRVVKNVAGYDLMKLHTGALGTLGVIAQVTLKLRPVPEETSAVVAPFVHGTQLPAVLDAIHATKTRPVSIVAYQRNGRGPGWPDGPVETRWIWTVLVGFDGTGEAVRWQEEQACRELSAVVDEGDVLPLREKLDNGLASNPAQAMRVSVRPGQVAALAIFAGGLSESIGITAYPGTGVVVITPYNAPANPDWDGPTASRIFRQLLDKVAEYEGNVVLQHGPTAWKRDIPVWGRPPADLALQKAVKRALDPTNLFNPGRFVTDA
jgi:glycolate oxidase FAD binding subunit